MKTDVITVSSRGAQMEAALDQVEKTAAYKGLSGRNALHLRLLTEEMMGMMRSITGETEGRFWIEDDDNVYQLHLRVVTRMDSEKREKLLSTATTGRNESARGLMGRLRDFFDRGADEDVAAYSGSLFVPGMHDYSAAGAMDWEWSMVEYESALNARVQKNEAGAKEAWDELEKSVVARVADEIRVYIRGREVEMVIYKKMA